MIANQVTPNQLTPGSSHPFFGQVTHIYLIKIILRGGLGVFNTVLHDAGWKLNFFYN